MVANNRTGRIAYIPGAPHARILPMGSLATFAFRMAAPRASRARLGDTLTADERATVLDTLSTARSTYTSANLWTNSHDLDQQFGVNAPTFQSLLDSGGSLDQRLFDVEGALRSDNPADWNLSADDIVMIQKLSTVDNQLWDMIQKGTVPATGIQPSSGNPDLFFLPPAVATPPAASEGASFGVPDLLKLVAAGGAVALPYFKNFLPGTTTPKPAVPIVPPSTGMPWWGWGLIGIGGAGLGLFLLRRIF